MEIGSKIRTLRLTHGMTLEDLASRTELTKGFLSQLERDLTSPSITTLVDILEALGTNLTEFFTEAPQEKVVFTGADVFEKIENALVDFLCGVNDLCRSSFNYFCKKD